MAQIDILRPIATLVTGSAVPVGGATLNAVTADNSDSTWISFPVTGTAVWSLRVGSHTPPAGFGRHRVRGRVRIKTNTGVNFDDIDVGRDTEQFINWDTVPVTTSMTEQFTSWFQDPEFGLAVAGALADLNIGGGYPVFDTGGFLQTAECYIDVDCRERPVYNPDVQDSAGVSRDGGTVTDTNRPTLVFGTVAYDGLPAMDWQVTVGGQLFSGVGAPPSSLQTDELVDGSYTAVFRVRSTIRGADAIEHEQSISFDVAFDADLPSPPNLTAEDTAFGIQLTWTNPGGVPWDEDFVVVELLRSDCHTGEFVRIATIPNALDGAYLDRWVPTLDLYDACAPLGCQVTYRARYWGTVSETIEAPSTIPQGFIVGYTGTNASIPSGWSRETSLDGRFPRGASATVSGATGGTSTHSHTTPGHTHHINSHSHTVGGSTGTSNANTTSARFNGASQAQADQPHSHTRQANTGTGGAATSGSDAPGTDAANNIPAAREVIFIESDGTPTAFPVGVLAYSAEDITGWTDDATTSGRYLRGAAAAGNGGATVGSNTHQHTVASHSHTGVTHNHSLGATGLSNPMSSIEAGDGSSQPEWLPRHTHPMTVASSASGSTNASDGGATGSASLEPPNYRLRIMRNTTGGLQTRVIGLYVGDASALPATLVRCDGSNGTPDLRNWFPRDRGADSLGTTGGTSTHSHTTGNHSHTMPSHTHTTAVGASSTASPERPSFGDLGDSPTVSHTHTSGGTGSTTPTTQTSAAGTTNSASHVPLYTDTHFVRLEGVGTEPLEVPQVLTSAFSEVTVSAITVDAGQDRLVGDDITVTVCTTRSYDRPRGSVVSVPIGGGLPTVRTTVPGQDARLTIAVVGETLLEQLEDVLGDDLIYWAPYGGTPGWYAPAGWSAQPKTPRTWEVSVTLTEQAAPDTENPEDLL